MWVRPRHRAPSWSSADSHAANECDNGFLTAALIGTVLCLLDRRLIVAGVLIALLACKPQFGVLRQVLASLPAIQWQWPSVKAGRRRCKRSSG